MSQPDFRDGAPAVPTDLLAWLELVYPDRFPEVQGTDPNAIALQISRWAGRLDVVRALRYALNRQSKKSPSASATA